MQKTLTSEPEDRMQTGTANRVRSKFRRDVREKKRRRDPLTKRKRLMYYRSTLGEGDSLSKPLPTVLSTIFVLGLALPQRLSSQAVYGSIVGTVLDATGAAVSGAKVTIRNVERDVANSTTTNESGNYRFRPPDRSPAGRSRCAAGWRRTRTVHPPRHGFQTSSWRPPIPAATSTGSAVRVNTPSLYFSSAGRRHECRRGKHERLRHG